MTANLPFEEFFFEDGSGHVTVKLLQPQDIDELISYTQNHGLDKEIYFVNTRDEYCAFIEKGWGIGCFYKGKMVAHVIGCYSQDEPYCSFLEIMGNIAAHCCDLIDIYVSPEFRGKGIQRLLISLSEELAKQSGMTRMLAAVSPKNNASKANFVECGYFIAEMAKVYHDADWHIFMKELIPISARRALIVIDYTYDFIADDGKLTCGAQGQAIEAAIADQIRESVSNGYELFICNDLHIEGELYHPERRLFPPHNIEGSEGRELFGEVAIAAKQAAEMVPSKVHFIDKMRYSSFSGTPLDAMLREREINTIMLCGVCTDICVMHTAVDAYNLGYDIVILKDCIASFDEEAHKIALKHFANSLGAQMR